MVLGGEFKDGKEKLRTFLWEREGLPAKTDALEKVGWYGSLEGGTWEVG